MTDKEYVKAEDLVDGRWESVLKAAGLQDSFLTRKQGPCPMCGGKDRFRFIDIEGTGHHYCNKCGPGRGWKLLMWFLNEDFMGAANWVREEWAGMSRDASAPPRSLPPRAPAKAQSDEVEMGELREKYRKAWMDAKVILPGSPAWLYLHSRVPGLKQVPTTLRSVEALPYWEALSEEEAKRTGRKFRKVGEFPGMLAAVQGVDGRMINLWRWFLTPDGKKAPVPTAKKAMGRFLRGEGYAVRLGEPVDRLIVSEGMETALAAMAFRGVPAWACLSEGGLRKFDLPQGYERVRRVDIYGDNDAPDENGRRVGNEAARELRDKLQSRGIAAYISMPAKAKTDFADIHSRLVAVA